MIEELVFATDQEWLDFRKQRIMASEIASFMGLNSSETGNVALKKKRSDQVPENNFNTRRGKILEPAVAEAVYLDYGLEVSLVSADRGKKIVHYNHKADLAATVDGILPSMAPVELKTSDIRKFNLYWRTGKAPIKYLAQLYQQMMVLDTKEGYLAGLCCREIPPSRVKQLFPSYGSIFPSMDVSVGLFKLSRNRGEVLDKIFLQTHKKFKELEVGKTWRSDFDVFEIAKNHLVNNLEFLGIKEGIPWKENEHKSEETLYIWEGD